MISLLLTFSPGGNRLHAGEETARIIEIKAGDHRFVPHEIRLTAGHPVVLHLVNTDNITPHNFTLDATIGFPHIDVDIPAGESVAVELTPAVAGRYTFYCDKKLPFLKSHREKGMEGTLVVNPE